VKNEPTNTRTGFLGCITAGTTHELNNVLAVIQESAGLMEDLILLSPKSEQNPREAFIQSLAAINNQIHRGVTLLTHLNRLVHSSDEKTKTINLRQTIEGMITLCQRFAKMKQAELTSAETFPELDLSTQPLTLQMAIFSGIQVCLDNAVIGDRIKLGSEKKGNQISIHILIENNASIERKTVDPRLSPYWKSLVSAASQLEGTVESAPAYAGIHLHLPDCLESSP